MRKGLHGHAHGTVHTHSSPIMKPRFRHVLNSHACRMSTRPSPLLLHPPTPSHTLSRLQDEHPPLPDKISPLMEDFLLLCFQKVRAAL